MLLRETFSVIHQLSAVSRFSRDHMAKRESVLEHIGFCVLFAYLVHCHLTTKVGVKTDIAKLMVRAALHDIDEAVTGDIPRITKYWTPEVKQVFDQVERDAVTMLERTLDTPLMYEWATAKDPDLEGCVMKLTDIAAVVYKVWNEVVICRNMAFCRVARELAGFTSQLYELLGKSQLEQSAKEALLDICQQLYDLNQISVNLDDGNGIELS